MTCTASMGLLMAELIDERGLRGKIALKKMIFGSERASDAMRMRISELSGVRYDQLFDIPGMTELYGPGTGLDCRYHTGIHYWADYYILEILNPETLEPVPEGEVADRATVEPEGVRVGELSRIPVGGAGEQHDARARGQRDLADGDLTGGAPGAVVDR